jgi:anaerobic selenocysteine-containing dehydrogenase
MTRNSTVDEIWPEATLEINPEDAAAYGLGDGDWIELSSRRGSVSVRALVTGRSPVGLVFLPFHFTEAAANLLTFDKTDPQAKIPDFKVCAVRIAKIPPPEDRHPQTDKPLTSRGAIKDQAKLIH